MPIIQFKIKETPTILFGVKLPSIMTNILLEIRNKKKVEDIFRNTLNIKKDRLINIVEARDAVDNVAMILVIYKNIVTEKDLIKMNLEIEEFNFNIFEFDFNGKIDIENIIENTHSTRNIKY